MTARCAPGGSAAGRAARWLLTAARVVALAVVARRVARAARPAPPVQPARPPDGPVVDVVVPARDEAARIGPLLTALVGAPGVGDVVVVDDGSTDDTAAIAAAAGARVITGAPLPPGWTGKAWALQQGIRAATAPWVVTLDADTRPDPILPVSLVARAEADQLDLLTVAGRFECPTRGVRWLHPAMLTTLVYRFGPAGSADQGPPHRLLANGQCMTLRREAFVGAGGMAPVASHTVEDVALARRMAIDGRRVAFLDASALLTVRMYESLVDTWRGWGRSLSLPDVEPLHRRVLELGVLTFAQGLPLLRVLARRGDVLDAVALAMRLGTLVGTARAYRERGAAYWCSPAADPLAVGAVAWGVLSRRRAWRGRSYDARPTPPGRSAAR